jgi:2-dehydro-3-deoxy-D-arabinonate dehydratase
VGVLKADQIIPLALSGGQYQSLFDILEADDPAAAAEFLLDRNTDPIPVDQVSLLAPIDQQEVWAAGVTYQRSQTARMDESKSAADCYERVYDSPRPELFFKANPHRVVGPGQPVRIRQDATWSVPEPELTLVLNSRLELVGYTIGNDMSSRDIEGENPLYLPQAKVYDACCALGPCITLVDALPDADQSPVRLVVRRGDQVAFSGDTNVDRMARTFRDLIGWLQRDNTFPHGAFLLTGTGIVPADDFTLQPGDVVDITVPGIGTLSNPVVQG